MATEKKSAAKSKPEAAPDVALDAEKIKSTEEASADNKISRLEKISPLLMTLIVAIPAAAIIVYINMPKSLDGAQGKDNAAAMSYQSQTPPRSMDHRNRPQQPEWVAQRRAEMEKRRAEFEKKNAEQFSFNDNVNHFTQAEPPQWVKDQQAKMEQEQARYQAQIEKQLADMRNNHARPWQNQPPTNAYPQAPAPYYNGYAQPVNPYYNGPYYQPGPYNGPYGYPYR